MVKMHRLLLLTFVLGYLLLVQGDPIDLEKNEESVEKNDLNEICAAVQGTAVGALGQIIKSEDGAKNPDSLVEGAVGVVGAPYSYYMKRFLAEMEEKRPSKPNIVIVWDGADYSTNKNRVDSVWIGRHRYFVYQWSGFGMFTLESEGGWSNWCYSGYFKRSGQTIVSTR